MPRLKLLPAGSICARCWERIKLYPLKTRIFILSMFGNYHLNTFYCFDILLEPVFWFIENHVRKLGPIFVGFLISMMGLVILIAYLVIIPYEISLSSPVRVVVFFVSGHWLLLNVLYNYHKAWNTSPGFPPYEAPFESVGMCKHCISPKPPRTHHCAICQKCVLKMDHHCPWLNQCVGHYNHRYFMLTMAYMWLACLYIVIGMWTTFGHHFWNEQQLREAPWCTQMSQYLPYSVYLCADSFEDNGTSTSNRFEVGMQASNLVLLEFFTALAMVVGVGGLLTWHIRLICRAETSIEQHINSHCRAKFRRVGKKFVNPYDYGWYRNWILLLGLDQPQVTVIKNILLPSSHKPTGDGVVWHAPRKIERIQQCNITIQ